MNNDERKFWYRVEDAIRQSGLSRSEIARRGGFHRQSIMYREGKGKLPQARILKAFCEVTGASADWLLGLKDEKQEDE